MPPAVAAADLPPSSPATQTRREQFDCPDCGARFRRKTRAGLFSRCPKCGGTAFGPTATDRIAAGLARRLELVKEAARVRHDRRRKPATADPPSDGPPASASTSPAPAATPEPKRRRPSPTVAPLELPAPSKPAARRAAELAPPPAPPPPPQGADPPRTGRGFLARLIGTDDE